MKPVRIVLFVLAFLLLAAGAYLAISGNGVFKQLAVMLETAPAETALSETMEDDGTIGGGDTSENTNQSSTQDANTSPQIVDSTPVVNEEPRKPELRFMAIGDIMLGRGVGFRLKKAGDYRKAFEKVSFYLDMGDIVFANLETPLTESSHGLDEDRKIVLKAEPESVVALTSAGINLVSLANNHMMDYYEKGLMDTIELLDRNNIAHAGGGKNIDEARKPAIIEKNGLKIGLLAYTDMAELVFAGNPYLSFAAGKEKSGVAPRKYEIVMEDVSKLRDQVDILAVSLHWGIEESFKIAPEQVEFARSLIDNGVDLILGHHPHQFQGIEVYKGKPIIYSMGNILFDQNDPENMESFIIDMRYEGNELKEFTAIPVRILEKSYVEIQEGEKAVNILERQAELCRKLGTNPATDNGKLVFDVAGN
jgi:poly-gamma-glutamate capsule biosynthesis protein CapA/YwtB (metallophosphatase superfamily)